jgi:myo-inositol-1(or 4)-monophosphatase
MNSRYADILKRIDSAIEAARVVFERFTPGAIETEYKIGHDPVTEADRAVDAAMRKELLREGEGWLSEESVDDASRLGKKHVWVVDPLDGTREFVQGIPEFCVSIGFVEDGRPVAGGIYNPATKEKIIGAIDCGVLYNGQPAKPSQRKDLKGSVILASRSELKRGEWQRFQSGEYEIRPMGSVAYKLGLVAAGKADVTFTLTPKNEWDVRRERRWIRQHTRSKTSVLQLQESAADRAAGQWPVSARAIDRGGRGSYSRGRMPKLASLSS